jgi:type IV pilus assembly protein PilB
VSKEVCEKHRIVPISRAGTSLIVAMSDPTNLNAIDDIKFLTGTTSSRWSRARTRSSRPSRSCSWRRGAGGAQARRDHRRLLLGDIADGDVEFGDEEESGERRRAHQASEDAPVVRLCNAILLNAIKVRASDIHIEPYEKKMRVRYRIDGVLREEMSSRR